jgi:hypothetical protein
MSAVQARVHYSMKQEFKLLKEIIKDYAPDEIDFKEGKNGEFASRQDYEMVDIVPVSDPNSSTMAQRIMQYQAVMQLASQAPQIYNLPNLHRQMIDVLGVKNGEDLVPVEDDEVPKDPISENMGFLKGEPTKAFIYQDHDAHIAAHTTFMQDPMIAQQIGQNPMANQMMAAVQSHIAEHLAFSYRAKIEQQMGVPMPAPDSKLPPEVEVQLSRLAAQASTQLLQNNQAKAQQEQAQQQMQDPIMQMQQQELQIKNAELQNKAQKTQADIQNAQAKLQLDHIKAQFEQQRLQLEAEKTKLQSQLEAQRIQSQTEMERMRLAEQQRQANQKVQVDLFKRNS